MAWITSSHHILGIKHLLGQFSNILGLVGSCALSRKWSETRHEKVKTWEWNHVDSQFAKISVQLAWEAKTSSHSRHGYGY
uniref:Candidate secreted effector n=1 Tax=Meloidogyne incognita TaxID=6306 RepID=A0A914KFQ2_MELIC